MTKIKSALISVFCKDGIDLIVKKLNALNVKIYSTGGTYDYIKKLGVDAVKVEDVTDYPSIFGGRVKTLHPKIFGGILYRRSNSSDIEEREKFDVPPIDLVIVDLYPFEQTVASGAAESDIIEKIDIGGISLIRAAAKNFNDVVVVPSQKQYAKLLDILEKNAGETTLEERKSFAAQAFQTSSQYDTAIFNYFNGQTKLRYGENPHQQAVFMGNLDEVFDKLHGKEISYNNLLDIDAAIDLIKEFSEPTIAIVKHNNACGCATRQNLLEAWTLALAGDPVSAFGGIIISNKKIDETCAEEMNKIFFEVIIAPEYDNNALKILQLKKNRIILRLKNVDFGTIQYRTALNGVLKQDKDSVVGGVNGVNYVTNVKPTNEQMSDLIFANKLVKHSKSNAIVLAKNNMLLASGVGQTSRVDALKHAIEKAESFKLSLQGAVMASDAFFPFGDCVKIAHEAGVTSIIQPGGSIRDNESVDYCNANNVAMVTTGIRHFRH